MDTAASHSVPPPAPTWRSSKYRLVLAIAAVLAITASVGLPQQRADAWNSIGCKWGTTAVTYYAASPLLSAPIWNTAKNRWAGLQATLTYSASSPKINATNENRGNTVVWTGAMRKKNTVESAATCPAATGLWAAGTVEVVINWSYATALGYTTAQFQGLATHEMGHALGLDHNNTKSGGVPVAVMFAYDNTRFANGIYSPKTDDKAGINALY